MMRSRTLGPSTAGAATLGLMAALTAAACGAGDAASSATTVRDSAGITIVENTGEGAWEEGDAWRLSAEPAVDIGVLEGAPEYQLFRVRGAARLSDGRIVVANAGTHELRFYDASGSYLSTSGGEGEGPGEFTGIRALHVVADDSLFVTDWRQDRITVYDAEGTFVRTLELPVGDGVRSPTPEGVVSGGRLVAQMREAIGGGEIEPGVQRRSSRYVVFGTDGTVRDTIGELPDAESYLKRVDGAIMFVTLPFGRRPAIATHGDRIFAGTTDRYEIAAYSPEGELVRLIRRAYSPVAVTPEDIERYKREELESVTNDDFRRQLEQTYSEVPFSETMPAFADIEVDAAGSLWVEAFRRPGDEQPRWSVFDPDGRLLGTVETPSGLEIYQIGENFVLGRATDEFDVEHVRLYTLTKPGV